jgi:hypothetical protein
MPRGESVLAFVPPPLPIKGNRLKKYSGLWAGVSAGSVFLIAAWVLAGWTGIAKGAEAPADFEYARGYKSWMTIHPKPIYSKSHGRRLVKTYLNPLAEQGIKTVPAKFAPGSIIVKDSWANRKGKPGKQAYLFIMKKEAAGSNPRAGDWFWAISKPDFNALKWGKKNFQGYGGDVQYCIKCHGLLDGNDYYFGTPEKLEEEKAKRQKK